MLLLVLSMVAIENLPQGAKVGTSSLRRKAQLLKYRPDLTISDLRGNLDTRLSKMDTERLRCYFVGSSRTKAVRLARSITQVLPNDICLPAVGQGALAIEARTNDARSM